MSFRPFSDLKAMRRYRHLRSDYARRAYLRLWWKFFFRLIPFTITVAPLVIPLLIVIFFRGLEVWAERFGRWAERLYEFCDRAVSSTTIYQKQEARLEVYTKRREQFSQAALRYRTHLGEGGRILTKKESHEHRKAENLTAEIDAFMAELDRADEENAVKYGSRERAGNVVVGGKDAAAHNAKH